MPKAGASADAEQIDLDFRIYDVVVMTQTCDIQNRKVDSAQAFARFFMRVGLPVDIPEERIRAKPKT